MKGIVLQHTIKVWMRDRKRVLSGRNEGIEKCWLTDTQCVKKKKGAGSPNIEKEYGRPGT